MHMPPSLTDTICIADNYSMPHESNKLVEMIASNDISVNNITLSATIYY